MSEKELFPDGTPMGAWFSQDQVPALEELGKQYILTDYGIRDDGRVYTREIQSLIDEASVSGGVIVVPAGTYLTGALTFRQGVHLYVERGGVLKGSADLADYILADTRIEGQNCKYFTALINADGVDGFTMLGQGTIDGNGQKSWQAFWMRRAWNPKCTNKDEQRPRLVYLSNCRNVTIAGLRLQNSHFWTTHLYRCDHVRYVNCSIFSPAGAVAAPSTDAIDIDVCTDVLVKGCYIEVNDDGVVLKGGKGPWADTDPNNGRNERVLVEDCTFGFCHACLTCGSESIHDRNIVMRRCRINGGGNLVRLKMRPDTPQRYEYLRVEDIQGEVVNFLDIYPWTQFYDLGDREDIPLSYADHLSFFRCDMECDSFFHVLEQPDQYRLSDFHFEDLKIRARDVSFLREAVEGVTVERVALERRASNCFDRSKLL
ncbi:MAG: glycosyl hydrolase family 28 protein [Candidatus Gastranaerophilales bacterium]|nr:glycosyl hydrolase family 28 protein [Candidatus Gastranaerophilales bacterium]